MIQSGIAEVAVLSDYFLTGLSKGLVKSIMSVEKLPTDMNAYYTLATRLDLQWRKGQELTKGTAPKKDTTTTPPKASNTVRLRKLDNEERARLRKEGRCFRCREQGHVAPDCPLGGQSNQPRHQIRVAASTSTTPTEPESAISRIRTLYAQFTPAEKEEVVNIAEAEGF